MTVQIYMDSPWSGHEPHYNTYSVQQSTWSSDAFSWPITPAETYSVERGFLPGCSSPTGVFPTNPSIMRQNDSPIFLPSQFQSRDNLENYGNALQLDPQQQDLKAEPEAQEHTIYPIKPVGENKHITWVLRAESGTELPSFKCTWTGCGKLCRDPAAAERHQATHERVHKYKCTCGIRFSTKQIALRHRNTKGKVYSCHYCQKQFSRNDYAKAHEKTCKSQWVI